MMLTGHLERIVERTHIDVPSHLGIALADRRKQRHQVEYRIDPMTGDDRSHRRSIQRIEDFERARFAERLAFAHIGRNDMRIAVNFTEVNCQFGTDLAAGTYNEDSFHRVEVVNSKVKIENNREKCAKFLVNSFFLAYFCTAKQGNCCCSSVVEHFLGKEEVTSSSLVNSSRIFQEVIFRG